MIGIMAQQEQMTVFYWRIMMAIGWILVALFLGLAVFTAISAAQGVQIGLWNWLGFGAIGVLVVTLLLFARARSRKAKS